LFAWTTMCRNNYCCNNVAGIIMVFPIPIFQLFPCSHKFNSFKDSHKLPHIVITSSPSLCNQAL
jgi:hypothetical protein